MYTLKKSLTLTAPQRKLLRLAREEKGLSTRKLGLLVGLSHATIANIERGDKGTSLETLKLIAKHLGLTIRFKAKLEIEP